MHSFRKFLLIILAALMAAYIIKFNQAKKETKPVIVNEGSFFHFQANDAVGKVKLNHVPIFWFHNRGAREKEETAQNPKWHSIALIPWMTDGDNQVKVDVQEQGEVGEPFLFHGFFSTKSTVPSQVSTVRNKVSLTKSGTFKHLIKGIDLAPQQFMSGAKGPHDFSQLRIAIASLHQAYMQKDLDSIKRFEAPLFADMERLTGRTTLANRQQRKLTIQKGRTLPLKLYPLQSFYEGRLIYAGDGTGQAPIITTHTYGIDGGWTIKTGRYWSKIDGAWRVVR